ncbi:hypothetical protein JVT61DRAFT_8680 [Boletus reticuloceps]|uniref:Uncharacterized protein n=1 Tax=Boletus reticuloceps TaxID=495285 RepID=A0A8I2YXW3_9AGAM|nr:hypothetical protein JVT61DRAFT_12285 [Boletus reticuloceps]KAG6380516.1 hypothetical protein JVT61DRAFT_8680 [Boletus reticuloceps]
MWGDCTFYKLKDPVLFAQEGDTFICQAKQKWQEEGNRLHIEPIMTVVCQLAERSGISSMRLELGKSSTRSHISPSRSVALVLLTVSHLMHSSFLPSHPPTVPCCSTSETNANRCLVSLHVNHRVASRHSSTLVLPYLTHRSLSPTQFRS